MDPYIKVYTLPSGTQAEVVPLALPDQFVIRAHHVVVSTACLVRQGQRRRWQCARCSHTAKHGYDLAVHAVGAHLHQPQHGVAVAALPMRHIAPPASVCLVVHDTYLAHQRQEPPRVEAVSLQTFRSWLTIKQVPGVNHPRTLPVWCRWALLVLLADAIDAVVLAA